jgi:uncharacterized protein
MPKSKKPQDSKASVYVPLTKTEKRKKIIFLVSALIAINAFVWSSLYFSVFKTNQAKNLSVALGRGEKNVSPTPFPFQEMTIPYLRNREYRSNLNELVVESKNESYTSYLTSYDSDGFKVNAQLTIPNGEKPKEGWPAIVFVHGYIPPSTYQTLGNYASYVDYLARQGFAVIKIDLRGHGESEGEAGGAYYSSDYIVDTLNARSALQNSKLINPEKIGLWGHSMAGNVVSRALAARPEIPAIVIWAGAVYTYEDFGKYQIQDNSYRPPVDRSATRRKRNQMIEKYGQFNPNSPFWKLIPMTNYLGDIKGAISLNHAVDDDVVNIEYSRNLKKLLDKTTIPQELNEYPSGGHNISGTSFNPAMENTVKFFNKYLRD